MKNTKQNIELVSKASPFQNNGNINQHDRPKTQNGTDSFNRPPPNRQPFERNENINQHQRPIEQNNYWSLSGQPPRNGPPFHVVVMLFGGNGNINPYKEELFEK